MKKDLRQIILEKAFELFHEKGYDETTIADIIERAEIARGSFYYHFRGKDELLNSVPELLDDYYREIEENFPDGINGFEKLVLMNSDMHSYMEKSVPYDLIANLYSMQITKTGGYTLPDRNRYYYILLNKIIDEGKNDGSVITEWPTLDIVNFYSMCERALVTDWCMNNADYSLGEYSIKVFKYMIDVVHKK